METVPSKLQRPRYAHTVAVIASGNPEYRRLAKELIEWEFGYAVFLIGNVYEVLHVLTRGDFELAPVILVVEEMINDDFRGSDLIKAVCKRHFPVAPILVHTVHDELLWAEAKDNGAIECFDIGNVPSEIPPYNLGPSFVASIRKAEQWIRLQFARQLDPLTSDIDKAIYVYNRVGVFDRFEQMWAEARKSAKANIGNSFPTCIFLDLVGFGRANEENHKDGDRLVREVAEVLCRYVRPTDFVHRLGGDEFIIFLPQTNSIDAEEKVIPRLAKKLKEKRFTLTSGKVMEIRFRAGVHAPWLKSLEELSAEEAYDEITEWANSEERKKKARELKPAS